MVTEGYRPIGGGKPSIPTTGSGVRPSAERAAYLRAVDALIGQSPVTAPGAVTLDVWDDPTGLDPDERPGDYLEDRQPTSASRYPPPAEAELVTLWKKDRRVVMSVTAGGKTQDFYMPPARLVYLLREVAEQLAENTILQ